MSQALFDDEMLERICDPVCADEFCRGLRKQINETASELKYTRKFHTNKRAALENWLATKEQLLAEAELRCAQLRGDDCCDNDDDNEMEMAA